MTNERLEYIRRYYNVDARIGGKVRHKGIEGVITGATSPYLLIDFGNRPEGLYHPTWKIEYLKEGTDA